MNRRHVVQAGALVWAAVGAALAIPSIASANSDARVVVGVAAVLGPLAAVAAFLMLRRPLGRWAGVLLLVSVVTPTYFAWVLNVPPLVVGLGLLAAPGVVTADRGARLSPSVG